MNTAFDFAPLWRSGIGFDRLFEILEEAVKFDAVFLELAIRPNLALATLDDELIRAGKAAGVALV